MYNLSFKTLIEKYKVVIPMLQRDYAYGRKQEKEKRDNFLKNLKSYFSENMPHELDFIYGSVDGEGNLILLDGQQRVTTLFLLHWYLSLVKDKDGNINYSHFKDLIKCDSDLRFAYKTRFTSTDFCNALVKLEFSGESQLSKFVEAVNDKGIVLSAQIKKSKWFLPHWNYDPTIISMLNMLDSIKEHFDATSCAYYYNKLVDDEKIKFNFLNLEQFNLTDELYIKMNSRGRALTRFENLKSIILKLYDEASDTDKYKEKLKEINDSQNRRYNSVRDYAAYMFDTQWTDMFWYKWRSEQKRIDEDSLPNVDEMMLSFITVVSIYEHILYKLGGRLSLGRTEEFVGEINFLMNAKDANRGVTISYTDFMRLLTENGFELLFNLIDYLNVFNGGGELRKYLSSPVGQFKEDEVFVFLADDYKNKLEYEKKVKAFAYVRYIQKYPNPDEVRLKNWMRFVCNVCANSYSLANRTDTFCTALAGINYLLEKDIVSSLISGNSAKDLNKLSVLDVSQIQEEILKMKLSQNVDWEAALSDAESQLAYFDGRLSYPLVECCGIKYDASDADIAAICNDASRLAEFKEYITKIHALFPSANGCVSEKLVPAMLSIGDYMLYFESNNTLLKNADRDNSWRRFLKEKPYLYREYTIDNSIDARGYFKEILDDKVFDSNNVDGSLDAIIDSRKAVIMPMWRRLVIDNYERLIRSEVFWWGKDRYIRWNTDSPQYVHKQDKEDNFEIDLISKKAINGYHAELFSLCKYLELKESGKIKGIEYQGSKTRSEQSYIRLTYDNSMVLKILYKDDGRFKITDVNDCELENASYDGVEVELLRIINLP